MIGAGVIGASVAYELARSGRSVISVDKGPAPGAGSTSSSASIIRFSYSTLDAVLTAWESAAVWESWDEHLGAVDPDGMARFVRTGNLIFCTEGYDGSGIMALWDDIGIPYERLDANEIRERFPRLDPGRFWPPKRIDDPAFADDATGELGRVLQPGERLHRRPDAGRPQPYVRGTQPWRDVPLPRDRGRGSTSATVASAA